MWKNIPIISTVAIGGFMISLTINSLGDTGNKIMHLGGGLLLFSGVIATFQMNRKR